MPVEVEESVPSAAASDGGAVGSSTEFQARLRSLQLPEDERRPAKSGGLPRAWWLVILVVILGGGYGATTAYQRFKAGEIAEIPAVTFAEEEGGDIVLDLSGYVVPRTKIEVAPRVGGMVIALPIEEGMRISRGELITQIDDVSFKADYLEAQAALSLAESRLEELQSGALPEEIDQARTNAELTRRQVEFLEGEFERAKRLLDSKGISKSDFDRMETDFQRAQSEARIQAINLRMLEAGTRKERVAAAKAEVDRAKAHVAKVKIFLDDARIVAPIDGTVLEKNAEVGEMIRPEGGIANLCVLADLSKMQAEVDVQERDLSKIKAGQPCQVIPDAYNDRVYAAKVDRLQPFVNRARGVVKVKVTIDQPDEFLLPEMNCRVLFLNESKGEGDKKKPRLPKAAVMAADGKNWVHVAVEGVSQRREVEVGPTEGDEIEIAAGLEAGEIVLVPAEGMTPLPDGAPVRPKLAKAANDKEKSR